MRLGLLLLTCFVLAPVDHPRRESLDFRYDILPLLHRQGCGSAYCHGSATGRGGFKLSLFASDPQADHQAITAELGGRRIDLRDPHNSLLLKKPSMQMRHGGGQRIHSGDPVHRALADWIERGAPYRVGPERELVGLRLQLRPDERKHERLWVDATFRDANGEFTRDVTGFCTFRSSDDRVAEIDETGRVERGRPGEAWLFARYVGLSARLAVVQPFGSDSRAPAGSPTTEHALDRLWMSRLDELGLPAGAIASSSALVRRLYLDLVDRLPNGEELAAFTGSPADRRVATTAKKLVRTVEFAAKFGRHLAEWLEIPLDPPERPNPRTPLFADQHGRLVADIAAGRTLHEIAERLLVRDRRLLDRFNDPRDRAELAGRAFLGIRIGCARCHDSPVDRWERRHHLAFSALFASPRPDPNGGTRPGILFDPDTGTPVPPRVLPIVAPIAEANPPVDSHRSHAEIVAQFTLRGGHRLFERNIANRTFGALMGRGLVEPLDDHRLSNPAIHESILDHLTEISAAGDLRQLVLHIVSSRMYQTSSDRFTSGPDPSDQDTSDQDPSGHPPDDAAVQFFARREARTMPPATFRNTVARALGVTPRFRLPDSPLARQLALLNSGFLRDAVDASPRLRDLVELAPDPAMRLAGIFELLLSRPPRPAETAALLPALAEDGTGEAARDLAFALLASREFGSIR